MKDITKSDTSEVINKKVPRFFSIMEAVIAVIKPLLLAFLTSPAVKTLAVDLLRALAKLSDNTLDDAAVDFIEAKLK